MKKVFLLALLIPAIARASGGSSGPGVTTLPWSSVSFSWSYVGDCATTWDLAGIPKGNAVLVVKEVRASSTSCFGSYSVVPRTSLDGVNWTTLPTFSWSHTADGQPIPLTAPILSGRFVSLTMTACSNCCPTLFMTSTLFCEPR